jgi:hypothetical protein
MQSMPTKGRGFRSKPLHMLLSSKLLYLLSYGHEVRWRELTGVIEYYILGHLRGIGYNALLELAGADSGRDSRSCSAAKELVTTILLIVGTRTACLMMLVVPSIAD